MGKYRKRPVIIEARHFEDIADGSIIAHWCGGSNELSPHAIDIETLEGTMRAGLGDWIIKGVRGEFYPCKPEIFEATYEPVIERVAVESSNVATVGYHAEARLLEVVFHNGSTYRYKGVPEDVHKRLMEPGVSVGTFLHKVIKGVFPFEKVDPPQ